MIRKAFRMSVHAGAEAEYERRHRPIWAELEQVLRDHGQAVARTDVCRRWWAHMREVMPSNPDASPVAQDLREVFHLARMPNGDGDPAAACDSAPDRALDPGRSHDASARPLDH